MRQYLSAQQLRAGLVGAVEQFSSLSQNRARLAVSIPPSVRFAAEVLAVDLPTLIEGLAVEHEFATWSITWA